MHDGYYLVLLTASLWGGELGTELECKGKLEDAYIFASASTLLMDHPSQVEIQL